jgi:hypothetical protein
MLFYETKTSMLSIRSYLHWLIVCIAIVRIVFLQVQQQYPIKYLMALSFLKSVIYVC